ncbi:hypothetical protein EWW49_31715, partial [Pseudomonas syringae]
MGTPTRHIVRPAGAGHETLYVLVLCLLILGCAAGVISLNRDTRETHSIAIYQLDARRDLSAAEQGMYADRRVTRDEIRLLASEQQTTITRQQHGDEGCAPLATEASSRRRGG